VDEKCLGNFETWCWVSSFDHVKNELLLHGIRKEINNICTIKRRKANCFGHILRRNCLLKHISEGKRDGRIKVMERRGRIC